MARVGLLSCLLVVLAGCATVPPPPDPALAAPPVPTQEPLGEGIRPVNVDAYLEQARTALAERNFRTAAEAAHAAAQADPSRFDATLVEAQAREAMGDLAAALPLWEALARGGQGGRAALLAYVTLANRRGAGEAALGLLEEQLQAAPDDPDLRGYAGWTALALGKPEVARRHLEAIRDPAAAGSFAVYLGRACLLSGDLAAAATAAERAAVAPGAGEAEGLLLGDVRRARGMAGGAEEAYRAVLEREPASYLARVNLAGLKIAQGDLDLADALLQEALEIRPEGPEAWTNRGLARRARGDLDGAREAYARALETQPEFLPALKNLGVLNEKYLGQPGAAVPLYDRYLEVRPDDEEVARWRKAALRLQQGEP